jgi:hypothetical protein
MASKFVKVMSVLRDSLPQASEADIHKMAELVIFAAMGVERSESRPMGELMDEYEEELIAIAKAKLAD